jgi:hypothetical protein
MLTSTQTSGISYLGQLNYLDTVVLSLEINRLVLYLCLLGLLSTGTNIQKSKHSKLQTYRNPGSNMIFA